MHLIGLDAPDLWTSKPDESHSDFARLEDRRLVRSMVDTQQHTWIVGVPAMHFLQLVEYCHELPEGYRSRVCAQDNSEWPKASALYDLHLLETDQSKAPFSARAPRQRHFVEG